MLFSTLVHDLFCIENNFIICFYFMKVFFINLKAQIAIISFFKSINSLICSIRANIKTNTHKKPQTLICFQYLIAMCSIFYKFVCIHFYIRLHTLGSFSKVLSLRPFFFSFSTPHPPIQDYHWKHWLTLNTSLLLWVLL